MADSVQKVCFVISPIGAPGSPERTRSDEVLQHIIAPAVQAKGYAVVRADQIPRPGMITIDIVQLLLDADLVIADLRDHNANVFYELAVRHATQKPVIQLALEGQQLPFDIAQSRTIFYNFESWVSSSECQRKVFEQVEAIENDPRAYDNPLSMTVTIKLMQNSANPIEQSVSEILNAVSAVRDEIFRTTSSRRTTILYPSVVELIRQLGYRQSRLEYLRPQMQRVKAEIDDLKVNSSVALENNNRLKQLQDSGAAMGEEFRHLIVVIREIMEELQMHGIYMDSQPQVDDRRSNIDFEANS